VNRSRWMCTSGWRVKKKVRCGAAGKGRERLGFRHIGQVVVLCSAVLGRVTQQAKPTGYDVNGLTGAMLCWADPSGPLEPAIVPHRATRFRPCHGWHSRLQAKPGLDQVSYRHGPSGFMLARARAKVSHADSFNTSEMVSIYIMQMNSTN
jgi:hypothetical protein